MTALMKTYEALPEQLQYLARAMGLAATNFLGTTGLPLLQDDRAAVLDEACAAYLNHCLLRANDPRAVRPANYLTLEQRNAVVDKVPRGWDKVEGDDDPGDGLTPEQRNCRHSWNMSEGEADEAGPMQGIRCLKCGLDGDS